MRQSVTSRPAVICLYSPVADRGVFDRVGFYRDDRAALASRGHQVITTNRVMDLVRHRPHRIVGYFYSKAVLAAVIGRLSGARVILTGGADEISPAVRRGLGLYARQGVAFLGLLLAHRILLSCSDDVSRFQRLALGSARLRAKIGYSPHIIRAISTRPTPRTPAPGQFRAFTICWMGSVANVRRKGVDLAIRLVAGLRRIGVDATLDIAGTDGPGRDYLHQIAHAHHVTDAIRFLGTIAEAEKLDRFTHDTVYLQLSSHEGFGLAAAEAFFSGMIVVHSNNGGLADVIGGRGLVVDAEATMASGESAIRTFYQAFLRFRVDEAYLSTGIHAYGLEERAKDLLDA